MREQWRTQRLGASPWQISVLVAVAAVAVLVVWSLRTVPLGPPDAGHPAYLANPADQAGPTAVAQTGGGGGSVAESSPARIGVDVATAVRGTVCDANGTRLEGLEVMLLRERQRSRANLFDEWAARNRGHPVLRQNSGADGSFAFVDLEPAGYTVRLYLDQSVDAHVSLARGETRNVELRFAGPR
ncbi:MAG: hypothetical protein ABIP94_07945, partial [Planctomycetota bacterium]